VAWCESKFRTTDIGFDSDGTHDRGLFQLNDGGTEQYLMAMIGQNPKNLNLAFIPCSTCARRPLVRARRLESVVLRFGDLTDRTVAHDEATKLA